MAKVQRTEGGCWLWVGALNSRGYAVVHVDMLHRAYLAHRYSHQAFKGPIPDGYAVDHLCRTPACVNPEHLEAVPLTQNTQRGDSTPLTQRDVDIALRLQALGLGMAVVAAALGVSDRTAANILTGGTWGDISKPNPRARAYRALPLGGAA